MALNRPAEAVMSYSAALLRRVDYADAFYNRGLAFHALKKFTDALDDFDQALRMKPDDAEAQNNRGNALLELKRPADALASYELALAAKPAYPDALHNCAIAQLALKRPDAAADALVRLLKLVPDYPFAKGKLLHAKMLACDWHDLQQIADAVAADVRAGRKAAQPFGYQAVSTSPRDLHACAAIYAAAFYPASPTPAWTGQKYDHAKIRVGYVAGEFREHATALLAARLFELHDKTRFEIFAFDNGWDDGSAMRQRLVGAFDQFVPIAELSDDAASELIRRCEIDILVNLNGYFGQVRQGIFARRSGPVQVNFLGFPGTLGADYMDYIVADHLVIPDDEQAFYSEKVAYLPASYQVNDSRRSIAPVAPTRAQAGLPEYGFVFCCFNNNYKITPEFFAIWMRLLGRIPDSVLWLFEDNTAVAANLRRAAARYGIEPTRLVFARNVDHAEHLARHRLADLFVDTLPYNAHTTASDALWAGLPLLTCRGTTFPGRVAASLLNAVGLPELIAGSVEEYATLAIKLATTPADLSAVRQTLAANRHTHPLFDSERFRRHIESAFTIMWEKYQRGETPSGFSVPPLVKLNAL
jgi:predicted O-linked N-acetylglucosamine transferase (SPINDLY family)